MDLLQDILFQYSFAPRPDYWIWHVGLAVVAFFLGLWQAYIVWRSPWRHYQLQPVHHYADESLRIEEETVAANKEATREETAPSFVGEPGDETLEESGEASPESEEELEPETVVAESAAEDGPAEKEDAAPESEPREEVEEDSRNVFHSLDQLPESDMPIASEPEPRSEPERQPVSASNGASSMIVDPLLGMVYEEQPELVDDLTRIRHLSPKIERRLNYYGIFRYHQVAKWGPQTVAELAARLKIGDQIAEEDWPAQASALTGQPVTRTVDSEEDDSGESEGHLLSHAGVDTDPELGLIFLEPPEQTDDLEVIGGLEGWMASALNELGVYRFEQIARWTDQNREGFARRLGLEANQLKPWVGTAEELSTARAKNELG